MTYEKYNFCLWVKKHENSVKYFSQMVLTTIKNININIFTIVFIREWISNVDNNWLFFFFCTESLKIKYQVSYKFSFQELKK